MKFPCLSYWDEKKFDLMSQSERGTFIRECFAYDTWRRGNSCHRGGRCSSQMPLAETKEHIGVFSCSLPMI